MVVTDKTKLGIECIHDFALKGREISFEFITPDNDY